jgi:AraC-like DNA-binding protein
MPFFRCKVAREITGAQQTYYPIPAIHPNRVMDEHDFLYLIEGEWEVWEENVPYLMKPGDLLILCAGRHHYGRKLNKHGTRILYAHAEVAPGDCHSDRSGGEGAASELSGIALPRLISCMDAPGVLSCFRKLVDIFWRDSPTRDIQLSAQFELLLCELATASAIGGRPLHGLAEKAKSLLLSNPGGEMTNEKLAEILGVSARHLRYVFEQEIGLPPYRYYLNMRLDMAMTILRNEPERTLRELAEEFGFCDEFHFSRTFKRRFGISPSQIRKDYSA